MYHPEKCHAYFTGNNPLSVVSVYIYKSGRVNSDFQIDNMYPGPSLER